MSKMSSKTIAKNPHRNAAKSCFTSVRVFHGVKSCVSSVHNGMNMGKKVIRMDKSCRQPPVDYYCLILSASYLKKYEQSTSRPITIVIYISCRLPLLLLGCLSLSPFGGGACAPPPPRRGVPKATHNNPTKDCFKKGDYYGVKNAAQKCFTKMQQNGE